MPGYIAVDKHRFNLEGLQLLVYNSSSENVQEKAMTRLRDIYWKNEPHDLEYLTQCMLIYTDKVLRDNEFFEAARRINPSLIVLDNLPYWRTLSVLAYRLGVPFAYLGTAYIPAMDRIPISFGALPTMIKEYTDHMDFWQRLTSTVLNSPVLFFHIFSHADAVQRYAPEMAFINQFELELKAEVTLVEQDHILDYPQPTLPNVIRIGGTAVCKAKELKEPYKSFVESSDQDIVVVSFGSYVLNIPEQISTKMMNAFLRLKLKVVWRVNVTSANPQQVMTSLWIPQNDLLGHAKVKVFVSHCGKNGQYEALYHAVPMLCLPLFGDQPYNAVRSSSRGYGLTSDVRAMSEDDLVTMINELYYNASYSNNIQKASQIFKDIYGLPKERAAFWLDHVIKYGGSHMRYAGQDLQGYQFYCLDVLAAIALIILCALFVLYFVLKIFVKLLKSVFKAASHKSKTQ
ncbi:UDP-glucuronosyltransferase 1-6-like [Aplysia californica]|uniref:UDP-glucuronosyltransferase n=1 Tax=Aplysia californica TaxID=6500 RepID=A0ABM0K732_APLCA|nr:UDP-glucuronosyltransferase 1-6-like [Aplysia californica]